MLHNKLAVDDLYGRLQAAVQEVISSCPTSSDEYRPPTILRSRKPLISPAALSDFIRSEDSEFIHAYSLHRRFYCCRQSFRRQRQYGLELSNTASDVVIPKAESGEDKFAAERSQKPSELAYFGSICAIG